MKDLLNRAVGAVEEFAIGPLDPWARKGDVEKSRLGGRGRGGQREMSFSPLSFSLSLTYKVGGLGAELQCCDTDCGDIMTWREHEVNRDGRVGSDWGEVIESQSKRRSKQNEEGGNGRLRLKYREGEKKSLGSKTRDNNRDQQGRSCEVK